MAVSNDIWKNIERKITEARIEAYTATNKENSTRAKLTESSSVEAWKKGWSSLSAYHEHLKTLKIYEKQVRLEDYEKYAYRQIWDYLHNVQYPESDGNTGANFLIPYKGGKK